jgi:dihydroorotate dehydrogenase (NAD+) catalytic subunit
VADLRTTLGPVSLRTPLIAASGTVGTVHDFAGVASLEPYGAAVAKSVSDEPWPGRPAPRLGPAGIGMLNGIGIQNPGIEAWVEEHRDALDTLDVPVWGSAVAGTPRGFAKVARGLGGAGVAAIEVNLSCPNLEDGRMFALDHWSSGEVVAAVRAATDLPVGAKLSPNASDIVAVASACVDAGADWLVLTNTAWGAAIDVRSRRPVLSHVVGGYSGKPLKPIALRCVWEVTRALPGVPVVGCGGVASGEDVVEYLLAGASAVALGSVHFAEPRAAARVLRELGAFCRDESVAAVADLIGATEPWQ